MSRLAPYGPTASTAMSRPYGGNAPSAPSRDVQAPLEYMGASALGYPTTKSYDPATGNSIPHMSQNDAFRSLYDLNKPRSIEALGHSYPTEIMDFPDVFSLPELAETWVSRLDARELWPLKVMPMRLTDSLDYAFTEIVYKSVTTQMRSRDQQCSGCSQGGSVHSAATHPPTGFQKKANGSSHTRATLRTNRVSSRSTASQVCPRSSPNISTPIKIPWCAGLRAPRPNEVPISLREAGRNCKQPTHPLQTLRTIPAGLGQLQQRPPRPLRTRRSSSRFHLSLGGRSSDPICSS